jgi:hypothetical protein
VDTNTPIAVTATFYPTGRGAAWRDPQRVEVQHDPARAGVWATVEGKRRLFCLARGVDLYASPAELGPDLSAWRGTLSVTTAEGKIRNIPLAKKLSQFLKKDTAEIPFQKISGRFQMARGLLTTDNFLLESKQADLSAKGNVRMTDMEANVALTAILPVGALGRSVGEWASGPDGRPRLSAKVTGPLTDPTLRADISKTAESAAKDLLKKGLEKWGVIPSSSVDKSSSTEKTVDRAVEQGKKALEKFFKRR